MGNCCSSSSPHAHDYYNDNKPSKKKKNNNNKFKNFRCFSSSTRRNYITDIGVDERCRWSVSSSQPLPPHLFSILHNSVKSSDYLFTKYQVGEELGRGEFGVTRRCTNVKTGETLACKTISKRRLRSSVDIEDVRQEVEIMRQMPGNPNVVQLRDVFEDEESVHIVMEICEGGELFDRIVAKGHYTERAAAQVLRTIIEIVQHCHKNGVIHRDLKPENFLFANASENSPLKVIDFGLSVFFKPGERFKEIVGSPYYMAPEVLKRNYGPQVDVWSAGVILYIMLCGVPPFWAETDEGIAKAIIKSNVDFTREPWPKISENAKDLVRSMLDPNQYTRLTAEQVIEHPWLQNESAIPNIPLGDAVRSRIKQFSLMNKFKKKALSVVTEHLPIEEVAHIKDLFHKMDTKKNGSLTLNELKVGLELIGHQASDLDVGMLMEAADIDGNGTVDCDEFVTITVHMKRIHSEEHLPKAFNYFDKNQSGYIELEELEEALGEEANSQLIHDIFADVDKNKDGRISYEEFKAMMKAGTDWRNASHQYSRAKFNALSLKLFKDGSIKI